MQFNDYNLHQNSVNLQTNTYVNDETKPTFMRTPAIPYNYMPRPQFTTSPNDLPAYNNYSNLFVYDDYNYYSKVDDKFIEYRKLDFVNPATASSNFVPVITKTSLINPLIQKTLDE